MSTRRGKAGRVIRALLIALVAGLLIVEVGARYVFDFPLYHADDEVGYWLQPNQSGTFMLNKQWHFNADSLGVAEPFAPSPKTDILLVGDSLVFGGNELDQSERLGPNVAALTGADVWPMAAGSWAIPNELAFLRRKPKLAEGVDAIVWVVSSSDFGPGSVWTSETSHPQKRPLIYLGYVFDKVTSRFVASRPDAPVPAPKPETLAAWSAFAGKLDKPLVVIAYNTQGETGSGCRWAPPAFRRFGIWYCYDGVGRHGRGIFRDSTHPNAAGNRALAAFVASALRDASRREPIAGFDPAEPEPTARR